MARQRQPFRSDAGQDIVEYALLASLLSIIAIATLQALSPLLLQVFVFVKAALMSVQRGGF